MYLSIAAILGTFLRIAMAQLFGEECANPGTVGWLAASSPLCVTKDGQSSRQGGIVFAVCLCSVYCNDCFESQPIYFRIFRPTCWGLSLWV
jgi:hypothetical protein